jgi:TolA-binding protein
MKRTVAALLVAGIGALMVAGCAKFPDQKLMKKGEQLERQEKFVDAIKAYEKVAKKYPRSPLAIESLHRVANIYTSGLQDYGRAVEAYDRIVGAYPDSTKRAAQAQFMIGFVYNNYMQDTAKARVAYETFLSKYPDHDLADDVQWELKYLGKDINDIPELQKATGAKTETAKKKKK